MCCTCIWHHAFHISHIKKYHSTLNHTVTQLQAYITKSKTSSVLAVKKMSFHPRIDMRWRAEKTETQKVSSRQQLKRRLSQGQWRDCVKNGQEGDLVLDNREEYREILQVLKQYGDEREVVLIDKKSVKWAGRSPCMVFDIRKLFFNWQYELQHFKT